MTPFEAMFGKPPPSIPSYITGSSGIEAADVFLRDRDELLTLLRHNMSLAQERMKLSAENKRLDVAFEVGHGVM